MTPAELREAVAEVVARNRFRASGPNRSDYETADAAIRVVVEACALIAEHHVCCTNARNDDGALKAADDIADAIRALATVKT